jgi:dynactin complex subunit
MNNKQNNVRIVLEDGRSGVIRFLGPTKFKEGIWAGIELDSPFGRNDGKINGFRYFYCPPNHGVFVHPSKVSLACGGPNFGDIIDSTPVKNPLTFPSFDQKVSVDKVDFTDKPKPNMTIEYHDSKTSQDKDFNSFNDKISILTKKIRHLEEENIKLQRQINESQNYSVYTQTLFKKCVELKSKIKDMKNCFVELNAAKVKTENFFESELVNIKSQLEKSIKNKSKFEATKPGGQQIEKNNMNLYIDWIFHLRRNKFDRESILSPANINSKLVDINNHSIRSLENIYLNIRKVVESFSNFKKKSLRTF